LGVGSSPVPVEGNYLFFKDVTYGTRERNRLDILLPQSDSLNGAVLFFHGGAFLFGTKEDLYEGEVEGIITALLAQNIAVVNAEYTFINDSEAEGVLSSLEDGAAVIQFITSKASALNLPTNKLILAGVSAGAGIAQWNGFRAQSNSQVQGVFATLAQSSYDLYQWEQLFPDFSLDSLRATSPELEALFVQFYNGVPTDELSKLLDYRSQMDATDPPLYVYNPVYDDVVVTAGNPLDFNVLFHSYKHADFLRKKAIEVGLDYSGAYQESPVDFILRRLLN
jgi:acetyl esterase/lipase